VKDPRRQKELEKLLHKLGLSDTTAVNFSLLDLALTHPTISQTANYEQLEFVGDAVIRLVTAEVLLESYPDASVGDYGAVRSILVSDQTLAEIAENYGIERYILIASRVTNNEAAQISLLADTFEAILGALYLSTNNMSLIRPWLDPVLQEKAAIVFACPARQNYKDALQEWTQSEYKVLPEYRVQENQGLVKQGERFMAEVWLKDKQLGQGKGRTKKAAEQAAAKEAFFSRVFST
jgi:ribonuclease-3